MVESIRKEEPKLLFINREWTKEEEELFGKHLKISKKSKVKKESSPTDSTYSSKKSNPAY